MNKFRRFKAGILILLLALLSVSMDVSAAELREKKDLQPGYTVHHYYNKKTDKFVYSKINLVIRKKDAGSVLLSQLPNQYRPGAKAKFTVSRKRPVHRKDGKIVRLSECKVGTKVCITFEDGLLESSPMQFAKILRIDVR